MPLSSWRRGRAAILGQVPVARTSVTEGTAAVLAQEVSSRIEQVAESGTRWLRPLTSAAAPAQSDKTT
jgi:hypothetical protein